MMQNNEIKNLARFFTILAKIDRRLLNLQKCSCSLDRGDKNKPKNAKRKLLWD